MEKGSDVNSHDSSLIDIPRDSNNETATCSNYGNEEAFPYGCPMRSLDSAVSCNECGGGAEY